MKRDISVTIKPTLTCNMRCKHCFNGEIQEKKFLPISTTCQFLELVANEYKNIGITFHGGEPTLAGIEYYREVFAFQEELSEKYGVKFANNFTTNGVALTDDLIDLLKENDVLINISFDGPHNHVLRQNTEQVYERLKEVQRREAKLRVYCVETASSYLNLFETYEWFKEHKLDFKMVPVQPQGNAKENDHIVMEINHFVENWMKLYSFWLTDKECNIRFLTFEEFLQLDRRIPFKPHWFYRKLALNPEGEISAFGRPNDIKYCLGTPETLFNINECFESSEYKRLLSILDDYMEYFCEDCDSNSICNGIAICSSFVYGDDYDMLRYGCSLADRIFQGVLNVNVQKYTEKVQKKFGVK